MSINTFYELLKTNAQRYPDNTAILYDTHAVTYAKLFADACKKAIFLNQLEGKRIALVGPASYRLIVNLFGAIIAGKDLVLMDSFLSEQERKILRSKVHPDYILSSTNQYILTDATGTFLPDAPNDDAAQPTELDFNVSEGNILFFTSGTSALAKCVVLTSRNLIFSTQQVAKTFHCTSEDRLLSLLPLNHVFGLVYSILWPLGCGACVCIGRGIKHMDFDTIYYLPTILPAFPALLKNLLEMGALNEGLKTIIVGESFCPASLFHALEARHIDIYSVYGLTSTASGVAVASKASDYNLVPFADVTITLAEDNEILIHSDGIMLGYDNQPEATAEVLANGALHSGDLGEFNDKGQLKIIGCKKDILALPNGEKLNCKEVEDYLTANAAIEEAVITLVHGITTAVLFAAPKSDLTQDLGDHIIQSYNKSKSYARHIQQVILSEEPFPKTASGKPDRWKVSEAYNQKLLAQ